MTKQISCHEIRNLTDFSLFEKANIFILVVNKTKADSCLNVDLKIEAICSYNGLIIIH